jgi:APA family basic amino acid/polyamine antiporter
VLIMVAPRVYYAMANDGLFFSAVAVPHPRFGTPSRAIAVQVVMASLLIMLGNFSQIISYFIFAAVMFLGLAVSTVFVFRRRGAQAGVVPASGYPYTPIFFLVLVVLLLALIVGHDPVQACIGFGVVAAGIPVYALLNRKALDPALERVADSEAS